MKKIIALLLSVCMIITASLTALLRTSWSGGNAAKEMLNRNPALSTEYADAKDDVRYSLRCGNTGSPWCAIFLSWCMNQAELTKGRQVKDLKRAETRKAFLLVGSRNETDKTVQKSHMPPGKKQI